MQSKNIQNASTNSHLQSENLNSRTHNNQTARTKSI